MLSRRRIALAAAIMLSCLSYAAYAAAAAPPLSGQVLTDVCHSVQDDLLGVGGPACRGVTAAEWAAAAACRLVEKQVTANDPCDIVDGRVIDEAQVTAYENSWVHKAVTAQYALEANAPLKDELLISTHNTFNASSYEIPTSLQYPGYYPTLTNQDPNQIYSISDQLNMDVRQIELDLHWFPSAYGSVQTGGNWVTLCHGETQSVGVTNVQIGCSIDRPVQDGFKEVADWMTAHPHAFVILYLENQLQDSVQAHTIAGNEIKKYFGKYLVPVPAGKPCSNAPFNDSQSSLLKKGQRLLIVGNCSVGANTSWGSVVHERGPMWNENGTPTSYTSADCAADTAAHIAGTSFRRVYEDQTFLSDVEGINPTKPDPSRPMDNADITKLVDCGVNLVGFDQYSPNDGRIAATVWSWAVNQPAEHGCGYQGGDTHFRVASCSSAKPYGCVTNSYTWHTTAKAGPSSGGAAECAKEFRGSSYATPVNGLENSRLAKSKGHTANVWVNQKV